jgi:tetratricopeptide (TPR) repeat protein
MMSIDQTMRMAVQHHEAGQLREAEHLYRSVLAQVPNHPDAMHLLGLIARRVGQADAAIDLIRRAIEINPHSPAYYGNLGLLLIDQKKLDEAVVALNRAIELAPAYPQAHNNLGVALRDLGKLEESVAAFQRAIALQPNFAEAYSNMSSSLVLLGRHEDAVAAGSAAIELNPGRLVEAYYNMGTACYEMRRYEEAAKALSRAVELQPDHVKSLTNLGIVLTCLGKLPESIKAYSAAVAADPQAPDPHWNLALSLLMAGEFERGWVEHEWRFACESLNHPLVFSQPQWTGEPLEGRTILLHLEQGFGDSIQFVRYAPMVAAAGGKVIVQTQSELVRLFKSIPGVWQVIARGEPLPEFQRHCPLMSLPLAFGTRLETVPATVPYLWPPEASRRPLPAKLPNETKPLRVGLVWAGRPTHKNDRQRSLKLAQLLPISTVEGIEFYSLQKGDESRQLEPLAEQWKIVDHTAELNDFADTAAFIQQLDLVIAVDTALAHLTGALGKPIWVLLPFSPDWRWMLGRPGSPWYPTMRLFRQPNPGDWPSVIEQVRQALQSWTN